MCSSVEQYFVDVIFYSWQKGDNERMRQKSESRSSRRSRLKYSFRIARFFLQVNGKTARKFLGSPLEFKEYPEYVGHFLLEFLIKNKKFQ